MLQLDSFCYLSLYALCCVQCVQVMKGELAASSLVWDKWCRFAFPSMVMDMWCVPYCDVLFHHIVCLPCSLFAMSVCHTPPLYVCVHRMSALEVLVAVRLRTMMMHSRWVCRSLWLSVIWFARMLSVLPAHVELLFVQPFCSPSWARYERYSLLRLSGLRTQLLCSGWSGCSLCCETDLSSPLVLHQIGGWISLLPLILLTRT